MRRRRLFLAILPGLAASESREGIPTDVERLNEFAGHYNEYVGRLKDNVVDVKLWGRVRRAWDRLQ